MRLLCSSVTSFQFISLKFYEFKNLFYHSALQINTEIAFVSNQMMSVAKLTFWDTHTDFLPKIKGTFTCV